MRKTNKVNLAAGSLIGALLTALVIAPNVEGQTYPEGEGAVWNSAFSLQGTSAVIYADPFSVTTDLCSVINAAIVAGLTLNPNGTTVDARGLADTGAHTAPNCLTNPFAGLATRMPSPPSGIKLLLGPIEYRTTIPWTLSNGIRIQGQGGALFSGSGSTNVGTTIRAVPGSTGMYPYPAVVQFGDLTLFGSASTVKPVISAGIEDLTIDCGVNAAPVGVLNQIGQSRTSVDRLVIKNCPDTGLEVSTIFSQNSGPYRDIVVLPGTGAVSSTTCLRVGTPRSPLGTPVNCAPFVADVNDTSECMVYGINAIEGLTCDASATATLIDTAVDISARGARLSDVFVNAVRIGIRVGSNQNLWTSGVLIENIHGTPMVGPAGQKSALVQLANGGLPSGYTAANFDVNLHGLALESAGSGVVIVRDFIQSQCVLQGTSGSGIVSASVYAVGQSLGGSRSACCYRPVPTTGGGCP